MVISISIKEQLAKLVKLQAIDTQIYKLNQEKVAKPAEVIKIEMEFEVQKKALSDLDNELKSLLKKRKDKELELGTKEESIKKLQNQLYSLKTNKEYQAMLKEIEGQKADCSLLEDAILKCMDEQDILNKCVNEEKLRLSNEEKISNEKKAKIQDELKEIDTILKDLDFKRNQVTPEVDKKILSVYERIINSRDGLAIVPVRNNSCHGCQMTATHQVVNEIKMFERLVVCETCARILYTEEDIIT